MLLEQGIFFKTRDSSLSMIGNIQDVFALAHLKIFKTKKNILMYHISATYLWKCENQPLLK